MRMEISMEQMGSAIISSYFCIRRAEMITPTLPRVSAMMWRRTPGNHGNQSELLKWSEINQSKHICILFYVLHHADLQGYSFTEIYTQSPTGEDWLHADRKLPQILPPRKQIKIHIPSRGNSNQIVSVFDHLEFSTLTMEIWWLNQSKWRISWEHLSIVSPGHGTDASR